MSDFQNRAYLDFHIKLSCFLFFLMSKILGVRSFVLISKLIL